MTIRFMSTRSSCLLVRTLARDEGGQDLVEYALLTAFIGLAGIAAWSAIVGHIGDAYAAYDTGTQAIAPSPNPGS